MENDNNEDNKESFGPHIKFLEGEEKNKKQKFFTVSYKDQNIMKMSNLLNGRKLKI